MAFGNGSVTVPSTRIMSSLGLTRTSSPPQRFAQHIWPASDAGPAIGGAGRAEGHSADLKEYRIRAEPASQAVSEAHGLVRTSGPWSVRATVCSKCADREPSA